MSNKVKDEYWQERFLAMEIASHEAGCSALKEIVNHYERAAFELQKDLEYWYNRLAVNNGLSLEGAKELLKVNELQEFHWTIEEYIEKGKTLNYSIEWAKELENASGKYHITRLESIEMQCLQKIVEVYCKQNEIVPELLKGQYKESYLGSLFELGQAEGNKLKVDFSKVGDSALNSIISKPWTTDGKSFSERIWTNQELLSKELQTTLLNQCVTGESSDKTIAELAERFAVDKYKAARLVHTERKAILTRGHLDAMDDLGVKFVQISAVLDKGTCEYCGSKDMATMPLAEAKTGVTAPPLHPNCRCVIKPYGDWEGLYPEDNVVPEGFNTGTRAARDNETGKTIQIPRDISYEEWREIMEEEWYSAGKGGNIGGEIAEALFDNANPTEFARTVAEAKQFVDENVRWRVTAYPPEHYEGAQCHITAQGSTVAVDGKGDIISVCRRPYDDLRGHEIVKQAVENGGVKLDSFAGNHVFYVKSGFEPISWCEWDEEQKPIDWQEGFKREPIIFYKYTGQVPEEIERWEAFCQRVPKSSDYGAAFELRDKELER